MTDRLGEASLLLTESQKAPHSPVVLLFSGGGSASVWGEPGPGQRPCCVLLHGKQILSCHLLSPLVACVLLLRFQTAVSRGPSS